MEYITEDLFSNKEDALAHCVSRDLRMGAGIAVEFRTRFGHVEELQAQHPQVGGMCYLVTPAGRPVFYLVTKDRYFQKPTYASLESSLVTLRDFCLEQEIHCLAIPRIGCGLDGLEWKEVQKIIQTVLVEHGIHVKVYTPKNREN